MGGRVHIFLFAVVAVLVMGTAEGQVETKWVYEGQSNLYAAPLIADMNPAPGLEIVFADSEAKRLRCLDAQGKLLWEYDGHWAKRLISTPALDRASNLLVVANGDGILRCIDASVGSERWRCEIGEVEWGGPLWADVDGDKQCEVVVGTAQDGVVALDRNGKILWRYQGADEKHVPVIRGALAASDVDGDGKAEIFGGQQYGVFGLRGDGLLWWERVTGDDFVCSPVLLDGVLYCASRCDNLLWVFDARTGEVRRSVALYDEAEMFALSLGDLNGDGAVDQVVGDSAGHLTVFSATGERQWTFSAQKPVPISATLGDVDGDGEVEALAACGDHNLYCIDARGGFRWAFRTGVRLTTPPTLADIDLDGKTEILLGGCDHRLVCLTAGGRYRADLMPWPSRRLDPAQSGDGNMATPSKRVDMPVVLFRDGDFEEDKTAETMVTFESGSPLEGQRKSLPYGWLVEKETVCSLDDTVAFTGKKSLRIEGPGVVSTVPIVVEAGVCSITVTARAKGVKDDAVGIDWLGDKGLIVPAADAVATFVKMGGENGWDRYEAARLRPPAGARWVQVRVKGLDSGSCWIDTVEVRGVQSQVREGRALVNQVGYDVGAPKCFTVQANWRAEQAKFVVLNEEGKEVVQGALTYAGRIRGAYDSDWGHEYWCGDFSSFDGPGYYRIRITLDDYTNDSWPFEVGTELIWQKTARPAYRFFYYQRCGMEIPGFHGACHLDDAVSLDKTRQYNLLGGWHDAGDYNKYHNAPYVYGLSRAYAAAKVGFDAQDEDHNGRSDFLDEIMWGGEHVRRMIAPDGSAFGIITAGYGFWGPAELETDNKPGTGDERSLTGSETGNDPGQHTAALARIAVLVDDPKPWLDTAIRSLQYALDHQIRGVAQFSAAVDLYTVTHEERFAQWARELFPAISAVPEVVDAVERFDVVFKEDHAVALREALTARADELVALADNPFGVLTFGTKDAPNFFQTPPQKVQWHVGTSSSLFEAATQVALAYQRKRDPKYLNFIYNQLNWTFGTNPYDVSLMEGSGSAFLPSYHQRLTFAGVKRGAVPGSIVNGVTWMGPHDDRPYLDMRGVDIPDYQPNEVWLPHNTNYLNALSQLHLLHEKK